MSSTPDLVALAKQHGTYQVEAYAFVGEGLRHASKEHARRVSVSTEHLAAEELIAGVLDLAASRYGLLARMVLRSWGLRRSEDIGQITFHLIDCGIFGKQPSDRLEDFDNGPDFAEVIEDRVAARLAEMA